MAYSEKVLDHYENPRNVGVLEDDDSVGTGMVGAPACGDVMKLQIKVSDAGIIEDAKFKTYGCGSAIASSSLVTEWVKGKSLDEAAEIKNTQIAEELADPYPAGNTRDRTALSGAVTTGETEVGIEFHAVLAVLVPEEELALPPVKIHCSVLAEDAIAAAIDNYRSKKQ